MGRTHRLLPAVPFFSTDKPTNRLAPWRLISNSTLPRSAASFNSAAALSGVVSASDRPIRSHRPAVYPIHSPRCRFRLGRPPPRSRLSAPQLLAAAPRAAEAPSRERCPRSPHLVSRPWIAPRKFSAASPRSWPRRSVVVRRGRSELQLAADRVAATRRGRSCAVFIWCPPATLITSPCLMPAFAAGLSG